MKMKKLVSGIVAAVMLMLSLASCAAGGKQITVVSREEGSGTRGAFTELLGIAKDDVDNTTDSAEISNSTSVVIQTVAGDTNAIGYVSLGSLNDTVKALKVDGIEATVANIKSGKYKVARPFNIATKAELSPLAQDFVKFIMSKEGQDIVVDEGYIAVDDNAESYVSASLSGTITIAGSTSVAPVMDVIADKYRELNPGVSIEIQQSGSSAGITSAIEGVCDIGMASRELKDSEKSAGLTPTVIAMDGIAVVVNKENTVDNLSAENIKGIYVGEITDWASVSQN